MILMAGFVPDSKEEARAALKMLPEKKQERIRAAASSTADEVKKILRDMTALRAKEHARLFEHVDRLHAAFGSPAVHDDRLSPTAIVTAMRGMHACISAVMNVLSVLIALI